MTTYQDPPLHSRRAVRQGERSDTSAPPFAPPQTPRTAAGAGEPLNYVTQNRPPLPGYEGPQQPRGRRSNEPTRDDAPEPQAPAAFRPRDFSPEARTAPPAWAPEYDRESGVVEYHTQARAPQASGSLAEALASEPTEQTLSRRELRAIRDAHGITAVPTETNPVVSDLAAPEQGASPQPMPQQPLSQGYGAPAAYSPPAAPVQPDVVQSDVVQPDVVQPPPALQEPASPVQAPASQYAPPAPAPSTQLDSAMAEFDALAGRNGTAVPAADPATSRRAGRRAAAEPATAPEDGLSAFDAIFTSPAAPAPQQQAPVVRQEAPVALPPEPAPMQPAPFLPEQVKAPEQVEAPEHVVAPEPVAAPEQYAPAPVVTPTTGERPVGHWSTQSDIDDRMQANESTISRTVGSGAITTSALILPALPGQNMSTGEVMLTDSINLPSALSSTGAYSPIDESDIDHLLDPGDHQLVYTDSVPIRAISAVSSHSSSRGVIASHKPARGNRALTALIVSASGMVVVVVTLLVVALVTDVF